LALVALRKVSLEAIPLFGIQCAVEALLMELESLPM
jgi:hypothetical protein